MRKQPDGVDHVSLNLIKIPLPVHVKEMRKQPDFDVTSIPRKTPSKLEEDLDQLLEIRKR